MAAPTSRLTQNTLTSQASDTVNRLKGAVCQIDTKSPGTGFLVTPNCLLTCCHVLPQKEVAQNAYACFSDIQSTTSVALNPDPLKNGFYLTSKLEGLGFTAKNLDFALVALNETVEKVSDLFVLTDQFPPQKEQIYVIQHPVIEVTKRDPDTNRPLEIKQLTGEMRIAIGQVTGFDNYIIHHTAPVAGGSSGAPIVNDAGHLYAFHQAECTNPAHKICTNPEHASKDPIKSKNLKHEGCEIQVNCGIGVRTDAVFRYLTAHHITLDDFEGLRQGAALKAKYAKQSHLELVRPVKGNKKWMLKFPIETIYTELVISRADIKKKENVNAASFNADQGVESYETLFKSKESISKDQFFSIVKNSRRVLILGDAGTGKTTFCQNLAFQWANGSILTEYQSLFLIRLRHLKQDETLESLFEREFGLIPTDKHYSSALLLIDGYDELPPLAEVLFDTLIDRFQYVIVTSRPKINNPFNYNIQLELIGLDTVNANIYIEHYFTAFQMQYPTELSSEAAMPKARRLQHLLLTHHLLASLAHIPVNLSLICAIFSQEESFLANQQSITVTALYKYIVNWMYSYFKIRQNELIPSSAHSTINDIASQDNPLSGDSTVKSFDQILSMIALNYTQSNKLMSPVELGNFLEDQKASIDIHQLNDSGLFRVDSEQGEFIHRSYQDFFVARYLANLYATNQLGQAQDFVRAYKLNERYKWIFWMTAGLLSMQHSNFLPQYFEDLHTLAHDLAICYELRLLARCYEECNHLDTLPRYPEFLSNSIDFLNLHPNIYLKAEFFRDCPMLLTQSEIIKSVCDFSFNELKTLIVHIAKIKQHIPEIILETFYKKSELSQLNPDSCYYKRKVLTSLYKVVVTFNQMLSKPCLEFVCSFFNNTSVTCNTKTDDDLNYDFHAFFIFTKIFEHQKINLGSLDAALLWLKDLNLTLSPETHFCLFVEDLIEHHKDPKEDPKDRTIFVNNYFILYSIGEFLGLTAPTLQEIFNRLLTSDSHYSSITNYYILELIAFMLGIESVSSTLSTTNLVELITLGHNQRAAHALKELLQIKFSINDTDLKKLIKLFKKETADIDKLIYVYKLKDSLADILSEAVINEHAFSSEILPLLNEYHCIKALVNITNAQKGHSEEAFKLILKNLKYYSELIQKDRWGNILIWLADLWKAPYMKLIADGLLSLFNTDQSIMVATGLLSLAIYEHFYSLEAIDQFIKFLRENNEQISKNVYDRIAKILCYTVKLGHPDSDIILEKVEQELINEKFHYALKKYFAQVIICAQEPTQQLSLDVIKALVSCMPNTKLKMLPNSLWEIEMTEITWRLSELDSILLFILKQPSIRLSRNSIIKLLNEQKKISKKEDMQALIDVFSVLNYQDYSHNSKNRELFIQIACLTGQPFMENRTTGLIDRRRKLCIIS